MKKRFRSRVLAVGMVGSTLLGAGTILYYQDQAVRAQEKPSPAEILDRASRLLDQKQYPEAKALLLALDPAQLPEDQLAKRAELVKQTDLALAQTADSSTTFDNAKTALDNGQLVQAAKLFQIVAASPNATPELQDNAKIQLALIKEKQKDKAPAMKDLLNQAIAAYNDGRLDEAQNALTTIENTGSDLGWENNAKPAKYDRLIAEKRVDLAAHPQPPVIAMVPFTSTPATVPALAPETSPAIIAATVPATVPAVAATPATSPTVIAVAPLPMAPFVATPATAPAVAPVIAAPTAPVVEPVVATPAPTAPAIAETAPATAPAVVVAVAPLPMVPFTSTPATVPALAPETSPAIIAATVPATAPAVVATLPVVPVVPAVPAPTTTVAVAPETAPAVVVTTATAPATSPAVVAAPETAPATMVATAPAPETPNILSDYARQQIIMHDRAVTLYDTAMTQSAAALKNNDFRTALDRADEARLTIDSNRAAFSDAEITQRLGAADKQIQVAKAEQAKYDAQQKTLASAAAKAEEQKLALIRSSERRHKVEALLHDAHRAYDIQQYAQCSDLIRQALIVDPTNDSAKFFLQLVNDRIQYRTWQNNTNRRSDETVGQQVYDEEILIPYTQLLIYPEDWPELSRRRLGETAHAEPEANRRVREALDRDISTLSAEQQGFERVVKYLADTQAVNIVVNWKALEGAGIDKNTPVSVSLNNVPFRKALTEVLSQAGGAAGNLSYTIDEGVITISTKEDLNSGKYLVVRVYDIRDMLVQPDATTQPPQFNLQQITASGNTVGGSGGGSGGGGGGGGGGGLFNDTGKGEAAGAGAKSRDDIVKDIIGTVQATVSPDSWRDSGGTIGSMKELNGQLIINQTVDNQIAVYNLLEQLRETRALQIAIEARLLLVTNNFLNDFGFGWGLTVPAGELGSSVSAFSVNNNTFTQVRPPSSGVPGNLSNIYGPAAGGGTGSSTGSNALDLSAQILDNFQLSLLLRATQADQRTTTVTAPRVTLFNGQRGYIAVTNQQNFVSNFNQTSSSGGLNGAGTVGTTLQVSTLTTGIVLYVEATVSADRRYVVMKLKPQLSSLDGIDTFTSGGLTSSTQGGTAATQNTGGAALVQLPRITYTTVDTMVSVPDGGTLLIGGQKLVGEAEVEVGVPVLSQIPLINRLFTNRSYTKDERTLLILVRPKIIIQREEEYKTFGMNYDAPGSAPVTPMVPGGAAAGGAAGGAAPGGAAAGAAAK